MASAPRTIYILTSEAVGQVPILISWMGKTEAQRGLTHLKPQLACGLESLPKQSVPSLASSGKEEKRIVSLLYNIICLTITHQ